MAGVGSIDVDDDDDLDAMLAAVRGDRNEDAPDPSLDPVDLDAALAGLGMGAATAKEPTAEADETIDLDPVPAMSEPSVDIDLIEEAKGASDSNDSTDGTDADDSGRRPSVDIPAEIAHDEVAVARHIVGTHNIMLVVDGDGAAALGWASLSVPERRNALVTYLGDLTAEVGAAADVIFDSLVAGDNELPVSKAVRVRLTADEVRTASILPHVVDGYPTQWPIAVVTDDEDLRAVVEARGATVMSNGQLLDLFIGPENDV